MSLADVKMVLSWTSSDWLDYIEDTADEFVIIKYYQAGTSTADMPKKLATHTKKME